MTTHDADPWPALSAFTLDSVELTDVQAHTEISILSATFVNFGGVPRPVVLSAAARAAGVLARIAVAAQAHIAAHPNRDHDCPVERGPDGVAHQACYVFTQNLAPDSTPADDEDGSSIAVTIPAADAAEWQARLIDWLARCA